MQTINEKIATAIVEGMDGCDGLFAVSVDIDENTVAEVSGWYEIDGYCEDDYYNGTGGWVTTSVCVCVEDCTVYTYDDEGEEVPNHITPDIEAIERYAEDMAA